MQMEKLTPLLKCFQIIFDNTMKELFTNKCLREETSLNLFILEVLDGSKSLSYVDDRFKVANIEVENKQNDIEIVNEFIKNTLKNGVENCEYILAQSAYVKVEPEEIRIFWTFFSECLDTQYGCLLARCVFEELANAFDSLLEVSVKNGKNCITDENMEQYVFRNGYMPQDILQRAAVKSCLYLEKLFEPLNLQFIISLSGEYYEKAECQAEMIFVFQKAVSGLCPNDFIYCFDGIEIDGERTEEIRFLPEHFRLIRKLLQIAQKDLCLVLGENESRTSFKVLGVCKKDYFIIHKHEFPYIKIDFKKHMQWEMKVNETYIFTYKNGQYIIEKSIDEKWLERMLNNYFNSCQPELFEYIILSTKQEHGTMLVIMEGADAAQEAKRLGMRRFGFPESERDVQADYINCLNNFDGSVILDTKGKIHGIGMILDGDVDDTVKGNLGRGARYNSAIKYRKKLSKFGKRAVIMIMSEDGMINALFSCVEDTEGCVEEKNSDLS